MYKMMMVAAGPPALISGQHHLQLQPTTTRPLSEVRLTRLSPGQRDANTVMHHSSKQTSKQASKRRLSNCSD